MSDNVAQSIKDLDERLKSLDKGLQNTMNLSKAIAENSTMLGDVMLNALHKGSEGSKEATKNLKELNKTITDMLGGKKEIKIAIDIERDKLKEQIAKTERDIKDATNRKDTTLLHEQNLKLYNEQLEQLGKFEQTYARINQTVNAGKGNGGTLLGKARADEMTKVQKYTKLANEELARQQRIEDTIAKIRERKGKSAKFDGEVKSIQQLNDMLTVSKRQLDEYIRTLNSLGSRGRSAASGFGGDGTKTALRNQEANFIKLNKLLNQRREILSRMGKGGTDAQKSEYKALNAEIRNTIGNMRELESKYNGITNKARQGTLYQRLHSTNQSISRLNGSLTKTKTSLDSMLPILRRLASAFGVAFSVQGLVNFGRKIVETRGEFELQQVALRSILQNKQLADEIWDKTMQAALQSPFTAMQLTKYTKQLAAYRIETDKLFDTTKRLADVSAGLGVDMQRLILAYGQVKAANFLRASEIRQFTEAGVNVLGELSNYFSETRGQMYSTAQVMDMVQKRMVKFEDVEEIFKRLTDEGGIFYNMQYVQSQTVWGQLRKLRDAYDQMQNSIGKANEGVIKDFVSILNSAVQNWRGIAVTLKSIGWGVAIGWMSKYALALSGISAASMKTKRAIVSLRQGIEGFGKALKANLPMLAIGAAAALITRFVESARQMKQVNDEIDEQITTLYGASQQMADYQSTLEKNNALIKSNGKEIADNKKRQEALNDALDSNRGIYSKLKNDYPQIAEQLKQNANGTIENTDALKAYNEQLEREMTLLAMREQKANIGNLWGAFSDSATEDLQDALKNTTKVQTEIRNLQLRLKTDVAKMKASGNVDERQMEYAERLLGIPTEGDIVEAAKRIEEIRSKYVQEFSSREARGDVDVDVFHGAFGSLVDSKIKELDHTIDEFRSEMVNIGWIGEGDNLGKLETDFVGIIENFSGFAKSISDEYSGDVLDFVANNSEIIKKAVEGDAENGIEASPEIVKGIGDALIKAGFATTKEMQSVWNNLLNDRIIFTKKNEELNAIDAQIAAEEAKKLRNRNQQLLTDLKKQRDDYIKSHGLDWFAGSNTTSGKNQQSPFDDNNKGKKSASKLISLIREMRAEYDKLSKSAYGYAKSEEKVRNAYRQSVREILNKAGVTEDYDFTTNEGMIAALEKVKAYADKLGPEAAAEVEKYIGQLKSEIELDVQLNVRKDFSRDLEKMFGNYELTLELQGLNIPEGMAKDLFPDLDYTTLGEIQDRMRKFYEEQRNANGEVLFDKDDLEEYRKWADKVDAEILKSRKEKAKQYSKYLEKEYSERAKLEMQHAKDVAFVTANVSDETQRKNIITQIDKKYQDDLNELHWKSFKESSFYVEMMDDISSLPKEYMQMMLDKIEEILQHPETLSPRALKEAINARQKVLEAQMNLEPLDVMRSSMKKIREAMADDSVGGQTMRQTRENLDSQIAKTQQLINEKEDEARCWDETAASMQIYENAQQEVTDAYGKLSTQTRQLVKNNGALFELYAKESERNNNQQQIQKNQQLLDEINKKQREGTELTTSEQSQMSGLKDQNATLEARNRFLSEEIANINAVIEKEKQLATIRGQQVGTDAEMQRGEGGVGTAAKARNRAQESKEEAENLEKSNQSLKDWLRSFKNFDDAFAKFNAAINSTLGSVQNMGNAFYDMFDALGGETNALTDGWKEFGNTMISTITQSLTMIPMMVAAFTAAGIAINSALGIVGLIAEGLSVLFTVIGAIAKLHDAHYEREIEIQQKKIDDLKDAYARLERQIEQTFTTSSYMREFNEQIENLREQMAALEAQRSAESSKKNADADRVREYTNAIIDAQDEIDELGQRQIEVFGGIGKDNYRSWAEGFVDAWKDAFLETGDGLDALQDHFDEFLQDWFVKQATMRIAGKALEGVMGDIDKVVSDNGVVDWAELQRIKDQMDLILPDLNDKLTAFAGMWDFGGEGSLSGLAAGIQGMTEEQANILEAYWNSVRMYTASIDMNVSRIADMLGAGSPNSNPMLTQLQNIANNTAYIRDIYKLLSDVSRNNGNGQGLGVYEL